MMVLLGLVRFIYPIVVFVQICPLFLFMGISLPGNLAAVLESLLFFQFRSMTPVGEFSAWMDIVFPPLTFHYYGIAGYVFFSKIFDLLTILMVIAITKFEGGLMRIFPRGAVRNYLRL